MSKKFIMSYMLVICLSLVFSSFSTETRPQLALLASLVEALDDVNFYTIPQEGFCAGTLVKVPHGYEEIQNLVAGDSVIDMDGNQTEVVSVRSHSVHGYLDIFLPEGTVGTGYDQLLYSSCQSCWIQSRNAYCKGRCINKPTTLYALTTGTHTYCVTEYDMKVHNAEVLLEAVAAISFGHITAADPIALLGGATAILATVLHNAQQAYLNSYNNKDDFVAKVMPDRVLFADRFYYEARKHELECAKQELLTIKSDLEKINALCMGKVTSHVLLGQNFPEKNKQNLPLSREKSFSEIRKLRLQKSRQADLALLEKQIGEIHTLLALHVDYVMNNVQQVKDACIAEVIDTDKAAAEWNLATIRTSHINSKAYQQTVLQECLLQELKCAVHELEGVVNYYRGCSNVCIREGTSIIEELDRLEPLLKDIKEFYTRAETIVRSNVVIIEDYFFKRNIPAVDLKYQVKNGFAAQRKARAAEVLKAAQMELVARNSAGGPNKNNKKNDDEERESFFQKIEIYEKNAPHIFRNSPGHFSVDNGANRKLLIDLASDSRNFLGKCKFGNQWYGKILENGQQIWASVRNDFIRNGGINKIQHSFAYESGLCVLTK